MDKQLFIYVLRDPDTKAVRYVGKADNLDRRFMDHIKSTRREKYKNNYKSRWIESLLRVDKKPEMVPIEEVTEETWRDRECYWISFYRGIGARLTNTARGGNGGVEKRSVASRKKQGDTLRGRKRGEEFCRTMSLANKGKAPSEATRKAQIAAITGKKQSPETIAKRTKNSKGNTYAVKYQYIATDPDGKEYHVPLLGEFCRARGLNYAKMNSLANGDKQRKQHKGWTCRFAE